MVAAGLGKIAALNLGSMLAGAAGGARTNRREVSTLTQTQREAAIAVSPIHCKEPICRIGYCTTTKFNIHNRHRNSNKNPSRFWREGGGGKLTKGETLGRTPRCYTILYGFLTVCFNK
jgi:hypothetical protein